MLNKYDEELTKTIEDMTFEEQLKLRKYLNGDKYFHSYNDDEDLLTKQAIEIIADAIVDVVSTICKLVRNKMNK